MLDGGKRGDDMNTSPTPKQRLYLSRIKSLPCGVCEAPAPSEAHHIEQSLAYTCIPLCADCHRGSFAGWHGQKRAWLPRKLTELSVLNATIERLS